MIKTYTEYLIEAKSFEKTTKRMTDKKSVKKWLMDYHLIDLSDSVKINDDLTVDAGYVSLKEKNLDSIPIQFGKTGYFHCGRNKLKSLKGVPKLVYGPFYCNHNRLTSLEYSPKKVVEGFHCNYNNLTSLEGCPKEVGGDITCNNNKLNSLVFAPKYPAQYFDNPCTKIYNRLGFTAEAHAESLIELDPNPKETLEKLKVQFPERYEEILSTSKELRILLGLESEELTNAYNVSKNVEGDFY